MVLASADKENPVNAGVPQENLNSSLITAAT